MTDQFPDLQTPVREITAVALKGRLDAGEHVVVLDTRRPADYETIIDANLGKAAVDDSEAFELELGPNNCAAGE